MKELRRAESRKTITRNSIAVLLLSFCFSSLAPAQSALLHGYVANAPLAGEQDLILGSASQQAASFRKDSFPQELQGSWQCVSVVVDSLVDTVSVGQKVVSRIDFVKTQDGRVVARFQQSGWTQAQESVTAYSATQYQTDKTNYYYGEHAAGAWAARSRDRYQLLETNRMIAESEVDQYVDGHYVGRYKTRSTLVRQPSGIENVALQQVPDPDDQSGDNINPFMQH